MLRHLNAIAKKELRLKRHALKISYSGYNTVATAKLEWGRGVSLDSGIILPDKIISKWGLLNRGVGEYSYIYFDLKGNLDGNCSIGTGDGGVITREQWLANPDIFVGSVAASFIHPHVSSPGWFPRYPQGHGGGEGG